MTFLVVIIILALIFDYINGFHDAANSIATVVSTKVLTPFQAVLWAALFNFVAFFLFKDHAVANTIAKTVHKEFITLIALGHLHNSAKQADDGVLLWLKLLILRCGHPNTSEDQESTKDPDDPVELLDQNRSSTNHCTTHQ